MPNKPRVRYYPIRNPNEALLGILWSSENVFTLWVRSTQASTLKGKLSIAAEREGLQPKAPVVPVGIWGAGGGGDNSGKICLVNHRDKTNGVTVSLNTHQHQEQIGSGTVITNTSQKKKSGGGELGSVASL